MALTLPQYEKHLAAGRLASVYLLASGEPLLLQEAADALRVKARAAGFSERQIFDAESGFDWNRLEVAGATLSLFATRRMLEIRLPTGRPGREGSEAITRFCQSPPADTLLLIVAAEWSRAHETAWVKAVEAAGVTVTIWPLKPTELPGWISRRLSARGIAAAPAAVALLAERCEGNLLAAAQEIDKLALLLVPRQPGVPGAVAVCAETMTRLVADSARYDVFALVDAAFEGDAARALRVLAGLRAEGEQVPALMGWLCGQLELLAQLAAVGAGGGDMAAAMRSARLWDARQALFKRALRRAPAGHWEQLLAEAGQVDRIAKGRAAGDAWQSLERLIVRMARPRALQPVVC